MMAELQALRMLALWPLVVGAAAFLLARCILWLLAPRLHKEHAVACIVAGVSCAVMAWAIAVAWDDGATYWLAFTVGMGILACILVVTCALLALEMWRNE